MQLGNFNILSIQVEKIDIEKYDMKQYQYLGCSLMFA